MDTNFHTFGVFQVPAFALLALLLNLVCVFGSLEMDALVFHFDYFHCYPETLNDFLFAREEEDKRLGNGHNCLTIKKRFEKL